MKEETRIKIEKSIEFKCLFYQALIAVILTMCINLSHGCKFEMNFIPFTVTFLSLYIYNELSNYNKKKEKQAKEALPTPPKTPSS
ncbi:hypothetical protein AB834_05365 [PVC group bacterium (ex Bugula neritina AB1)]|nr:hypothetical protein AB834_05365 [PVC group bacterium (ex Bugula neritina AB1)]